MSDGVKLFFILRLEGRIVGLDGYRRRRKYETKFYYGTKYGIEKIKIIQ